MARYPFDEATAEQYIPFYTTGLALWPSVLGQPGSAFEFENATLYQLRPACDPGSNQRWANFLDQAYGAGSAQALDSGVLVSPHKHVCCCWRATETAHAT